MLCAYISVAQFTSFIHRQFNYFFRTWRICNVGRLLLATANQRFYFILNFFQSESQADQCFGCDAFAFTNEAEQNMLSTDVIMTETDSFFLRECEHLLGPFRKSSKHHISCTSMVLDKTGALIMIPPYNSYHSCLQPCCE
ncbi:hypothetical protein D3C76_1275660 [compost metagenome]